LNRIDDRTEAIENLQTSAVSAIDDTAEAIDDVSDKLTLLMSETNITPELHSDVLQMASTDPRNTIAQRGPPAPFSPPEPPGSFRPPNPASARQQPSNRQRVSDSPTAGKRHHTSARLHSRKQVTANCLNV
jgi:hypothetical protein